MRRTKRVLNILLSLAEYSHLCRETLYDMGVAAVNVTE